MRRRFPAIQAIARVTWEDTYRGLISAEAQKSVLDKAYSVESLTRSIRRTGVFLVAEMTEPDSVVVGFAHVERDNQNARAFYRRMGFTECEFKRSRHVAENCTGSR